MVSQYVMVHTGNISAQQWARVWFLKENTGLSLREIPRKCGISKSSVAWICDRTSYKGTKFKKQQDLWVCSSFRRHILQSAEIVPNTCCKRRGHGRGSKFSKNVWVKKLVCGDSQVTSWKLK